MDKGEFIQREKAKILVVDDDYLLRSFMETALFVSGYDCICAEDGLAALNLLEKNNIDMVISDIEMPRLNGLELLSQIKKQFPTTKTLLISGKYRSQDTLNGISVRDADSFLTKPFPLNLFLSTIQTVLLTSDTRN